MAKWIQTYLKESEVEEISKLVGELEKKTSAEIVPMIARSSSATGHVPLSVFLLLFSFGLMIEAYFGFRYWYAEVFVVGLSLICALLAYGLSRLAFVQRLFVSKFDQWEQVRAQAELEFHRRGLDQTQQSVGVLLYVSVMERKAFVLADKGISERVDAKFWQNSLNLLLEKMKSGQWAAGFQSSLTEIGGVLAEHFPVKQHDVNELPNSLIIRD